MDRQRSWKQLLTATVNQRNSPGTQWTIKYWLHIDLVSPDCKCKLVKCHQHIFLKCKGNIVFNDVWKQRKNIYFLAYLNSIPKSATQ